MSAPIYLMRARLDAAGVQLLWSWGFRRGYLPAGADPGYALHAALNAAFGLHAPKPFVFRELDDGGEILGYTLAGEEDITSALALSGGQDHEISAAFRDVTLDVREMPQSWRTGGLVDFEVRVRPVVRTKSGPSGIEREAKTSFERDAFLWALESEKENRVLERGDVYTDWLHVRFRNSHAVHVKRLSLVGMRRSRLLVRPSSEGRRTARLVEGPDAIFRGTCEITDSAKFSELIGRGIGRHRSFGFGCLLLAPPGSL